MLAKVTPHQWHDLLEFIMRIFFMHIAKAAGTALNAYLHDCFPNYDYCAHVEGDPNIFTKIERGEMPNNTIWSGHLEWRRADKLVYNPDVFSFFVVRNPVQHVLSHIKWVKAIADDRKFLLAHDESIQELAVALSQIELTDVDKMGRLIFEESRVARGLFDNCQLRYVAGHRPRRMEMDDFHRAAAQMLCFSAFSCVEDFPKLQLFFERVCRFPKRKIPRINLNRSNEQVDLSDPAVSKFYGELVRLDAHLYTRVRNLQNILFKLSTSIDPDRVRDNLNAIAGDAKDIAEAK